MKNKLLGLVAVALLAVGPANLAANVPPAWDDVLGSLEEELARLDATRQADLARTLH